MSIQIGKKPIPRRFQQARWDEPVIFELSEAGQRGVLLPEVEAEVQEQAGDVLAALARRMPALAHRRADGQPVDVPLAKDSPANGTSASIARLMSGSRVACSRLPIRTRPFPVRLPSPSGVAFFSCRRGASPSPAARRLCRNLAGGSGQRLWMSIAGSSSGDA